MDFDSNAFPQSRLDLITGILVFLDSCVERMDENRGTIKRVVANSPHVDESPVILTEYEIFFIARKYGEEPYKFLWHDPALFPDLEYYHEIWPRNLRMMKDRIIQQYLDAVSMVLARLADSTKDLQYLLSFQAKTAPWYFYALLDHGNPKFAESLRNATRGDLQQAELLRKACEEARNDASSFTVRQFHTNSQINTTLLLMTQEHDLISNGKPYEFFYHDCDPYRLLHFCANSNEHSAFWNANQSLDPKSRITIKLEGSRPCRVQGMVHLLFDDTSATMIRYNADLGLSGSKEERTTYHPNHGTHAFRTSISQLLSDHITVPLSTESLEKKLMVQNNGEGSTSKWSTILDSMKSVMKYVNARHRSPAHEARNSTGDYIFRRRVKFTTYAFNLNYRYLLIQAYKPSVPSQTAQ